MTIMSYQARIALNTQNRVCRMDKKVHVCSLISLKVEPHIAASICQVVFPADEEAQALNKAIDARATIPAQFSFFIWSPCGLAWVSRFRI